MNKLSCFLLFKLIDKRSGDHDIGYWLWRNPNRQFFFFGKIALLSFHYDFYLLIWLWASVSDKHKMKMVYSVSVNHFHTTNFLSKRRNAKWQIVQWNLYHIAPLRTKKYGKISYVFLFLLLIRFRKLMQKQILLNFSKEKKKDKIKTERNSIIDRKRY